MKICVYGSLRRGGKLHGVMQEGKAEFLGATTFPGDLFHLGSYPAAIKGSGTVHCEMFECPEGLVKRLDGIEGHPWVYQRQPVQTSLGQAEAYIYQRRLTGARPIPDGNYNVKDWK